MSVSRVVRWIGIGALVASGIVCGKKCSTRIPEPQRVGKYTDNNRLVTFDRVDLYRVIDLRRKSDGSNAECNLGAIKLTDPAFVKMLLESRLDQYELLSPKGKRPPSKTSLIPSAA